MKAIVTGAAGFAGYSLTRELVQMGHQVYAVLRPGSAHNDRFDGLQGDIYKIELDCTEFNRIADVIQEEYGVSECDVFYHLAWFGGRDDFAEQIANIDYCISAMESAASLHCKRFVGIGSQAEYGVTADIMTESMMPFPVNAYGAAKTAAMYLSRRRAGQLGIEWCWGRIFSLYGDMEPTGRMLPDLLRKLAAGEAMQLSSCRQNWDYLHVVDAARAIIAIGERGHADEIYNIARGDYKPLREFVEQARDVLHSDSDISYGLDPDPFISLQPDVTKLMEHTGWRPEVSFEDGIKNYHNDFLL